MAERLSEGWPCDDYKPPLTCWTTPATKTLICQGCTEGFPDGPEAQRIVAALLAARLAPIEALAEEWEARAVEEAEGWGLPRQDTRRWPYVAQLRAALTASPTTSRRPSPGSTEGERDGKQSGVHPVRTREVAEGPDGGGVHGGSGFLDRSGPDSLRAGTARVIDAADADWAASAALAASRPAHPAGEVGDSGRLG